LIKSIKRKLKKKLTSAGMRISSASIDSLGWIVMLYIWPFFRQHCSLPEDEKEKLKIEIIRSLYLPIGGWVSILKSGYFERFISTIPSTLPYDKRKYNSNVCVEYERFFLSSRFLSLSYRHVCTQHADIIWLIMKMSRLEKQRKFPFNYLFYSFIFN
jgi:hypothetical protein